MALQNKSDSIALLSLFSSSIKFLVGPLTLVIVSTLLTTEEIGFYYTFLSIVAAQEMMEFGLGNVIRQHYAHSKNQRDISRYYTFSLIYYSLTSILFLIIGQIIGLIVFDSYQGNIQWLIPWTITVSAAAIKNLTLPVSAYLDGVQQQEKLQVANIYSSIFSSIVLWLALWFGFGLYSLSLYMISFAIFFMFQTASNVVNKNLIHFSINEIKSTFSELWVLLRRTAIVWMIGYLFWNGFNLISFSLKGAEFAGVIGFSIALARAGVNISNSMFLNQTTLISKMISDGYIAESVKILKKYLLICSVFLIFGFLIFTQLKISFPTLPIINKTIDVTDLVVMFSYF
ncbi:TPA: hypothetical protein KIE84_004330, partial [Escherichia coli]|nr:hypothetical protein [Escherichia coli]